MLKATYGLIGVVEGRVVRRLILLLIVLKRIHLIIEKVSYYWLKNQRMEKATTLLNGPFLVLIIFLSIEPRGSFT